MTAYIYDAIRSPRGKAKADGGLASLTPHQLLDQLYAALLERNAIDESRIEDFIDEAVLGCVTQHGEQAANIAKTSLLHAGWPQQIAGITVNRFCSSGLDAINIAQLKVLGGQAHGVIAGGVEMMSRVPMLSDKAAIFSDPKYAIACQVLLMGSGADLIASLHDVSREQADQVALLSQQRAANARDNGYYSSIIPISTEQGIVTQDECIRANTTAESLAELAPAFAELGASGADNYQLATHSQLTDINHVHTAGNSPAMADAAAMVLIGNQQLGEQLQQQPKATIVAAAMADDDPLQVVGGCVTATKKLLKQQNLTVDDVDLFEIHEAFAATTVRLQKTLNISDDKLNVNGGVIALGHPMGATGAIMMGTLIDELERRRLQRGIVATSGAAGSGTALLIER